MGLIPSILLAWAVLVVIVLSAHARTLRELWREPALSRPVVIVESDDWGPGPASDALALQRIAAALASVRDADGRPAVMTLGVVLGKPDGAAILGEGCRHYHRSTLDAVEYRPVVQAMREGCAAGVFTLQRHGLEHCWPDALLERARQEPVLQAWLGDPAARSEALPSPLQSRWVDAAVLPSRELSEAKVQSAVAEEAALFARLFGAAPAVAVPNTFVWNDTVERAWADTGVRWVVSCGRRYEGRGPDGGLMPPTRQTMNAQAGTAGVRYVVRDAYFEPARGHRAEQVWQAVAERSALGRPTLLETHRDNFTGAPEVAERALAELERALRGVLRDWPEVCFLSTAALGEVLVDANHPLRLCGPARTQGVFLARLLATPALSRALKLTGLRLVLPALARMLRRA